MPKTDDGEFELILGNRQLLSVFFIVVVLLGVFFTMGYIVGKSSATDGTLAAQDSTPLVVNPATARREETAPASTANEPKPVPIDSIRKGGDAKTIIEPARKTPEPATAEKAAPKAAPKEAVTPESLAKGNLKRRPILGANGVPVGGQSFFQVVASTRSDCDLVAGVLGRKGLPAVVVPGPSADIFRVLVGPLGDNADISSTREELAKAGFDNPYYRKY